jgi:hypothetical protein
MRPFVPKKMEPVAFGFILAGMMTFFVSGISTAIAIGVSDPEFFWKWAKSWLTTWAFAFPIILFVAPIVRRILKRIVVE